MHIYLIMLCFSGNLDEAQKLCKNGFFLGIDGPITYPNSDKLRYIVKNINLHNILIETDCPYLAPQSFRGQRNEPMYLPYIAQDIAQEIANIKEIPLEKVCEITTNNAQEFLNLSNKL